MDKRQFLSLATFGLGTLVGGAPALAATEHPNPARSIQTDGVLFSWHHHNRALFGTLSAPTKGWIAVGFNEDATLKQTRFIMAATSVAPIQIEEHLALVPDHRNVIDLGLKPALQHASGSYADRRSHLEFQISHEIAGRPALSLAPGSHVHLMLAWSQAVSFDHHSAWRKHISLTL